MFPFDENGESESLWIYSASISRRHGGPCAAILWWKRYEQMFRSSFGITIRIIGILIVFILATAGPVLAKPKSTGSDPTGAACDSKFKTCSDRCGGHSMIYALDQAYKSCVDKCEATWLGCMKTKSINPGTNSGTLSNKLKSSANGRTQQSVGGGGTNLRNQKGINPVVPFDPGKVNKSGKNNGSGTAIYKGRNSGESITNNRGFATMTHKDWDSASGSIGSSPEIHHRGKH